MRELLLSVVLRHWILPALLILPLRRRGARRARRRVSGADGTRSLGAAAGARLASVVFALEFLRLARLVVGVRPSRRRLQQIVDR